MNITKQITNEFQFEIECYSPDEFDQFRDMMEWISDNTINGRVHFKFEGGMLGSGQKHMWMNGRIIFTNDHDNVDSSAFKLRWL